MDLLRASAWDALPHHECIVGLESLRIGRIALSVDALPVILPVYYVLDEADVVFRTTAGSALDRNCRNTVVAFEIDSYDPGRRAGWSVLVVGVANILATTEAVARAAARLDHIRAPLGDVYFKIPPGTVTGRALAAPARTVVVTDE